MLGLELSWDQRALLDLSRGFGKAEIRERVRGPGAWSRPLIYLCCCRRALLKTMAMAQGKKVSCNVSAQVCHLE
jgi:hypothetical protein